MGAHSLVVISVDGLRASALGACGNTWFGTPYFDRLASESLVLDQCYAESSLPVSFYESLAKERFVDQLSERGLDSILATDDSSVRESPFAEAFDRVALVPASSEYTAADDPADIASAEPLALLLDQIEQTAQGRPVLAWAHLRFASGPWDAPLSLSEGLLGEDDPCPEPSVIAPCSNSSSASDDATFEATVRYAAQVMALDRCLGVCVAALDQLLGEDGYRLALMGVRGFALGEHGRVGGDDLRPYSEVRHVPFLLRPAVGREHRRSPRLMGMADIHQVLLAEDPDDACARIERNKLVLHSPTGHAIQDHDWRLVTADDSPMELYSKPDDRWEMNDVASRFPHVVEELEAKLAATTESLERF